MMSYWTHITACIYLETDIESHNIKDIVEKKLQDAPKITGSEGNADVFVTPLSGHNLWTSEGEYQTSVCIAIIGDLRDRFKKETQAEYMKFRKWLLKDFEIRQSSCSIEGY